jgi:Ni/Co efflux regulator RcnB
MRKAGVLAAAMLGATLFAAGPVLADPPHCPPGHAKKGWCGDHRGWDRDRDWDDRWERDSRWERENRRERNERIRDRAYEQGYRDAMEDAWRVGQRIPSDRYRVVPDYYNYGWPDPRDGRSYVYADDRYYLIEQATGLILDILAR